MNVSKSGLVGSTAKFRADMAVGEDFESRFISAVERDFTEYVWYKHKSCSGTKWHCKCFDWEDIATLRRPTIECKKDWKASHSGNMAFEAYCLTDKLKADYWVQELALNKALWFRTSDLRTQLPLLEREGAAWRVMGGDNNKTEMIIVGLQDAVRMKHLKLYLDRPLPRNMFT